MTPGGVGGFQLRVGAPPGAPDPLVAMAPPHAGRAVDVSLHEAVPHDPSVPGGKGFARVEDGWAGGGAAPEPTPSAAGGGGDTLTALPGTPPVRVMSGASLGGGGSRAGSVASLAGGGPADAWPPSAVPAARHPPDTAPHHLPPPGQPVEGVTFLMNGPSLAALAFRVDVRDTEGALLGRGFVPAAVLAPLEGSLVVPLLSPDGLGLAGEFRAAFLVVTALDHPANTLAGLQRARWTAGEGRLPTMDIGHRGVGASAGARARVAENTVLAFAAAAAHHTEYVEFDVHVTADGEVVVHHDFDVRLALGGKASGNGGGGGEGGGGGKAPKAGGSGLAAASRAPPDGLVALPIAALTLAQLTSPAIAAAMRAAAPQGAAAAALSSHEAVLAKTLKRTLSSGEDIVRSHRPPPLAGSPAGSAAALAALAAVAVRAPASRPGSGPALPPSPLDAVPEEGGGGVPFSARARAGGGPPPPAARSNTFAADAAAAVAAADAAADAAAVSSSHHPPTTSPAAADAGGGAWRIADARVATLRECFRSVPPWVGFNIELKYPADPADPAGRAAAARGRNAFCDAVLGVALDEGLAACPPAAAHNPPRRIIFSTFDPDCATLLSLKQPRFPVFFLTCAGGEAFPDPRMNTLAAALEFAAASRLQGVVAEAGGVLAAGLARTVAAFHSRGLHLFTWGAPNNDPATYAAQRAAGVDAIISDDVAQHARASGKRASHFVGGAGGQGAGGQPGHGTGNGTGNTGGGGGPPRPPSTALAGGSPVSGLPLLMFSTPPAVGPLATAADLLAALEAEGAFEERPRGSSPTTGVRVGGGAALRGASPPRDIPKAVVPVWDGVG